MHVLMFSVGSCSELFSWFNVNYKGGSLYFGLETRIFDAWVLVLLNMCNPQMFGCNHGFLPPQGRVYQ